MVIWRGWGFLAVVYIGLLAALFGGAIGASALQSNAAALPLAGLGILIGGVLTAIHGWYLNVIAPKKRAEDWATSERPRLEAAAADGTLVVDNVAIGPEEATGMIDGIIDRGRSTIGQHGPHSVFWIPMEIIGILAVIGGIIMAGVGVFNIFTG